MSKCEDCIHSVVCFKRSMKESLEPQGFELECHRFVSKDVVEVVRCKDCIHWGGVTYGFVCRKLSGIETKICMGADHFCSYGELKDS